MSGSFTRNAIATSIFQLGVLILGIGTSIIIARALGPERKGIYALVVLFASFFVSYTTFGLHQASVFYLGRKAYPAREVFGHSLIYVFVLSALATACGLAIIFWFGDRLFPGVQSPFLLLGLLLIPAQLLFGFLAQVLLGLQEIGRYNVVQLLRASVLLMVVVALLLWLGLGVQAALLAEFVAFSLAAVLLFILVYRRIGGMSIRLNPRYLKDSFRYGLTVYAGRILVFLHYRADMFLINLFLNPAMVGLYTVSAGLSEKLSLISDGVATVLFPRISSEADPSKIREFTPLVFRTVLLFVMCAAAVLALVSPWLIPAIYSGAFADSVRPFQMLLLGAIALTGWSILESDFNGRGKPIWSTVTSALSVVINIGLNVLWIPRYGITGAAYASAVSYVMALLIALIVYCRLSGNGLIDVLVPRRSDLELYRQLVWRLAGPLALILHGEVFRRASRGRDLNGGIYDEDMLSR
jgi:O-antigen/teichoic acid export membrane protein